MPETKCGAGSTMAQTAIQREWIPRMVEKHGIKSIADLGAGDLNWASRTAFGCEYTPYDLVPRAHGVKKLDILTDKLPEADCLMVLWVINHMTPEQAKIACARIMQSKARFLMVTNRPWGCWNFFDCTVLDAVDIGNDAEIQLCSL